MIRRRLRFVLAAAIAAAGGRASAAEIVDGVTIGERPTIENHLDQSAIEKGEVSLPILLQHGKLLFDASFNALDGQGRPATTGTGIPRSANQPAFVRVSGPDSNSCFGCHNQPRSGGSGDFVTNVFVLAQERDPVLFTMDDRNSNERATIGMMGTGAIELLAREMSAELIAIRTEALAEAKATSKPSRKKLVAKGVSFGEILAHPDGLIDPRGIDGVDWDLVVKPFHQKGAVVSLRDFSNTAMNHHHGLQSAERFGKGVDADKDGKADELTEGDITAVTAYQATLNLPGRVWPAHPARRAAAENGEALFAKVGCTSCHIPAIALDNPVFTEPGPYNPPGNLRAVDVARPLKIDLTREGPAPHLVRESDGRVWVRAFTDLKRHDINDGTYHHFANEKVPQGSLIGTAPASVFTEPPQSRPVRQFLTHRLWDSGNTPPYGHRGDLTTLTEAIHYHGGEARTSRDAFFALSALEQASVIEFLKTLQVVPDGSPPSMIEDGGAEPLPPAAARAPAVVSFR